ncbi:MAG: adenylate kinase [Candidatus Acidulodesulfobacterium acidiphilum]|uniref:Adenylate kinase n=1 Tax=Candidatus Acidulodesulfobacterium acidiphilum TaxID=2597224 RepID=A0A520XCX3_9DELT|nr:MAG: adenylate kinase [Candidatus Acidulodesulfobacterium acidiphilum]
MKSKIFILIGPPGAGKGTQAKNIAVTKDFVLISTGDLLRENVEKKTELGQIAKSYMDKGEFVPIELVAKIIKTNIQQNLNKKGFLFDGFPRDLSQNVLLDEMLNEFNIEVDRVIYIDVKDEAILDRLTNRRVCPKCKKVYHMKYNKPKNDETCDDCGVPLITRDDDKPEVIKNRLATYHKVTHPLVEHFEKLGKVIRVNGEKSPKEVETEILSLI